MTMYKPPHPGEFIQEVYLEPLGGSPRSVALRLKVSPSTFVRILKRQSSISPVMALRLSKCLGRTPESWLHMQDSYNLWHAKQSVDLSEIEPIEVPA
ncbi:HigA family addiction module antidote protein [Desulforhopalus vacuolatus]|uniref:HigA family addiction module antitoxin n=1 Tax=Desulforhopalus vacuolatus TaxID=40414 RepID=UPI001962EEF2|nr:HigA family addiction module antidote protein [Desulforhopalus vacuolatus]